MEVVLREFGNRTGAVPLPMVPKDPGLSAGQAMTPNTTEQCLIVLDRKRRYLLDDAPGRSMALLDR